MRRVDAYLEAALSRPSGALSERTKHQWYSDPLAGVPAAVKKFCTPKVLTDPVRSACFAGRRAINALGLRFHLDHQHLLIDWPSWARRQTAGWISTTDPGSWECMTR